MFNKLKEILVSSPILANPDFSCPFILQTDSSEFGLGAVLSKVDAEGCDHPVAYFSRKLLPSEQRYATVKKECLAIKLGVEAFQVYLPGREFIIKKDHRALQWLTKFKNSNHRLMQARSKLLFTGTANNKSESTLCSFAHVLIYAHIIVYKV